MASCEGITAAYKQWVLSQHSDDFAISESDSDKLVLTSEVADGQINFYDIDGSVIVEMRLERKADGSSMFFLHFELEDLDRAKGMFSEMVSVLSEALHKEVYHVLLCCTCGMTTTFFANKLNQTAAELSLACDFCAKSVEEAKKSGTAFVAVLLAPQVSHQLKAVQEALPGVMVLALPGSVFGAYDAHGALRVLMEALQEQQLAAKSDLRFIRDFDRTKRVLSISYVMRYEEPTISYFVLDKGEEGTRDVLVRQDYDLESAIEDVVMALRINGYEMDSFDAVGIAVPGVVDDGVVRHRAAKLLYGGAENNRDIATYLHERFGVPVYVDNNATAAAAGCYVSQDDWGDIVFHAQPVGLATCEEGFVLDGKPHTGYRGFSGSMRYLADRFALSMDLSEAVYRYDGVRELVACYLSAAICTVAPQAVFVWCEFLPDMDELREGLEKILPADAIPELVAVEDYDGLTVLGELALCLQRLAGEA